MSRLEGLYLFGPRPAVERKPVDEEQRESSALVRICDLQTVHSHPHITSEPGILDKPVWNGGHSDRTPSWSSQVAQPGRLFTDTWSRCSGSLVGTLTRSLALTLGMLSFPTTSPALWWPRGAGPLTPSRRLGSVFDLPSAITAAPMAAPARK